MANNPPDTIATHKRHRERLLRVIVDFSQELRDIEARLLAKVHSYKPLARLTDLEHRQWREREYLNYQLEGDEPSIAFQKRWRVTLHPSPEPPLTLSFTDDFFVEPVSRLDEHYVPIRRMDKSKLLVVDTEAGQNAALEALRPLLAKRPKGSTSRLPSRPPFQIDPTDGRDFEIEDPITVDLCFNSKPPGQWPQVVAARAYPQLAKEVGYSPESYRIVRWAPRAAADRWARIVKGIRKRLSNLKRTLGPFAT